MGWCQIDKPSSTEIKKISLRLSARHCPVSSHGDCEDRPLLRWLSCPGCLLLVAVEINKQQVCWRCCCCLERRLPAAASSSRAAAPASLLRREGPSFPPPSCSNLLPPFPLSQPPTFLGGIIQKNWIYHHYSQYFYAYTPKNPKSSFQGLSFGDSYSSKMLNKSLDGIHPIPDSGWNPIYSQR